MKKVFTILSLIFIAAWGYFLFMILLIGCVTANHIYPTPKPILVKDTLQYVYIFSDTEIVRNQVFYDDSLTALPDFKIISTKDTAQ